MSHSISLANIFNTGISVCFGLGIYLLIVSHPGQKITETIRNVRQSFNTTLLLFVIGFVALVIWPLFLEAL